MSRKTTEDNLMDKFENGEDVLDYFDVDNAEIVYPESVSGTRRVNVDFPIWVVDALDREAKRIGVGRQAVIKTWIVQHLDEMGERPV